MGALLEMISALSVEEIGTLQEMESLEREWAELWSKCPDATPFQSPDWLIPWWKYLGEGELWILALRQEGALVGVAPLVISTSADGAERKVLFLGTGISDYLDVLADADHEQAVAAAVLAHLELNQDRWKVCDFQQMRGCSLLLETRIPPQWKSAVTVQEVCPVLPLPEDTSDLSSRVPASMLEKLRYYRRRTQKLGPTEIEQAEAENFSEHFESFLHLHRARWSSRGQNGVLADEHLQAFHHEAAHRLLSAGALRLYGLRVGGQIEASFYGFSHGQRTYFYLGGFAPHLAPLSPGTLMIGHAIEQAIREGAVAFDFLRGREAYKYMWGAKGCLNYRRRFAHPVSELNLVPST